MTYRKSFIHFLRSTIQKQAFIVLAYRKCWHIANPILSGRILKKSLQPLNILVKIYQGIPMQTVPAS